MKDRQSVALPWTLKRSLTLDSTRLRCTVGLGIVCRRGSRAAAARPVAVEELAALFVSALVAAAQCASIPARAIFRCDGDACAQGRDANGAGWQGLVSVLRVLRVLEGTSARTIKRYAMWGTLTCARRSSPAGPGADWPGAARSGSHRRMRALSRSPARGCRSSRRRPQHVASLCVRRTICNARRHTMQHACAQTQHAARGSKL